MSLFVILVLSGVLDPTAPIGGILEALRPVDADDEAPCRPESTPDSRDPRTVTPDTYLFP